jgi:hypothetical protein
MELAVTNPVFDRVCCLQRDRTTRLHFAVEESATRLSGNQNEEQPDETSEWTYSRRRMQQATRLSALKEG